jgi:hypothetical protein
MGRRSEAEHGISRLDSRDGASARKGWAKRAGEGRPDVGKEPIVLR